jgi:hypothetical protein
MFDTGVAKNINFAADTIKVSLHTSTYAPNIDTDDFQDDLTNEVVGAGYVAGGKTVASPTVAYDAPTNVLKLDADDPAAWTVATFTCRYAVVYDATPGAPGTNPLICYIDFGADVTMIAGTFTLTFAAGGIAKVTVS